MKMETKLPYLSREPDRHGNDRIYVRRHGRRIRVKAKEGTPEFAAAYSAALARTEGAAPAKVTITQHAKGTLGWLGAIYFGSDKFKGLDLKSQQARRSSLEECFREPLSATDPDPMGDCPLRHVSAHTVRLLIGRKDRPGAKANRKKHLSALLGWGAKHGHLPSNPARDTELEKPATDGFYTWTLDDVAQFEARWPIGTKPRLALALLLFTGARRQDMVTFGRQHVRAGWLRYVPLKTIKKRRKLSQKPWLPELDAIVAASPCGSMTFLETAQSKPFTANGFGNWFRDRCNEAGLPQCTAHGLRKAGATRAAEAGATVHQLMAIFDWSSISQAEVYTRAADQKRLAGEAMGLLVPVHSENDDCRTAIVAPKNS
jgi:integrase